MDRKADKAFTKLTVRQTVMTGFVKNRARLELAGYQENRRQDGQSASASWEA